MTRRGLAELLAIVAPPACLACREPLGRADQLVCGGCLAALPWLRGPRCDRCGLPPHRRERCPAAGAAFARAWSPMAYDGAARALVGALKWHGALPAAGLMAAQMTATLPGALRAGVDARVELPRAAPPPDAPCSGGTRRPMARRSKFIRSGTKPVRRRTSRSSFGAAVDGDLAGVRR